MHPLVRLLRPKDLCKLRLEGRKKYVAQHRTQLVADLALLCKFRLEGRKKVEVTVTVTVTVRRVTVTVTNKRSKTQSTS